MTDRFCVYKAQMACNECGNPVILDGPLRRLDCPHCQSTLELPPDFWKLLLEDALQDYATLDWNESHNSQIWIRGMQVRLQYGRQLPRCPTCRESLAVDEIPTEHDGAIFCGQCGKQTSTHRSPPWLREVLPNAVRLYCAATEEDPDGAQKLPDAGRLVVMSCLQCGAPLRITGETSRITTCEYCETDLYLPDALWRRLHPVKKRVPWYIRYR